MASDTGDDQRRLLAALVNGNVEFIVIGGHAVAAHGFARSTRDVDIVFATTQDNCARLAQVLADVDATVVVADLPAPDGKISGPWLAGGGQFIFRTACGMLDAFTWIAGNDHNALASGSLAVELQDGTAFRVCGYEDLIEMKRQTGRAKDEEDLRQLRQLDADR